MFGIETETYPANIYLFKIDKRNTKKLRNIFKVNNKNVVLVFLLLTLNIFHTFFRVSIVDFEQVNVNFVHTC